MLVVVVIMFYILKLIMKIVSNSPTAKMEYLARMINSTKAQR
jgi:hypothetical protein